MSKKALTKKEMGKEIRLLKKELRSMATILNKRSNQRFFEKEIRNKEGFREIIDLLTELDTEYGKLLTKQRKRPLSYLTEEAHTYINAHPISDEQPPVPLIIHRGALITWMWAYYRTLGIETEEGTGKRYVNLGADLGKILGMEWLYCREQTQSAVSKLLIPHLTASDEEADLPAIERFLTFLKPEIALAAERDDGADQNDGEDVGNANGDEEDGDDNDEVDDE